MDLLTRQEAAQRLRIALRTLDRRIASGELDCHRFGDGPHAPVRISIEQINDFLNRTQYTETYSKRAKNIMGAK